MALGFVRPSGGFYQHIGGSTNAFVVRPAGGFYQHRRGAVAYQQTLTDVLALTELLTSVHTPWSYAVVRMVERTTAHRFLEATPGHKFVEGSNS